MISGGGNGMNKWDSSTALWQSFAMFEKFDSETIAKLELIARFRKWVANTVIFQRGDPGDYMIAVLSGRVKLSLISPQGRELGLRQIGAGVIFGEMAMFDDQPRSADALALEDTKGYIIPKNSFLDLVTRSPSAADALIRHVCGMLRETTEQLEGIALYDLNARVARFFLATIRQIYNDHPPTNAQLKLTLSQSEIAEILGASRPKVNRALLALEEGGGIVRSHGIVTCDIARLHAIAEPNN